MVTIEMAKMSERGQIIIPKEIREYLNAEENTIFTIMPIDPETIIMKKLDKNKLVKEFRNIRTKIKIKLSPEEVKEEIRKARHSN